MRLEGHHEIRPMGHVDEYWEVVGDIADKEELLKTSTDPQQLQIVN